LIEQGIEPGTSGSVAMNSDQQTTEVHINRILQKSDAKNEEMNIRYLMLLPDLNTKTHTTG
jgi:V8-like Glu-specific endopeptidase